ncbi:transposase [Streptomyces pseudogriseolus]|uniref:transposase n=1 Tax=Streptomyces pseudogriseolus TaxID=36817 RepID=UPI00324FACD4
MCWRSYLAEAWQTYRITADISEPRRDRQRHGRRPRPLRGRAGRSGTSGRQEVKADATVAFTSRGYDAGKKINGRKRHLLTDTLGLLLAVLVTPASTTDRDAARLLLPAARGRFGRLARVWADGGYTGHLVDWSATQLGVVLDIVRRSDDIRGFQVLPRRWVVERSFAWCLRSRRLVRDYERRTDTSEAVILWSMITLLSRRLAARGQGPVPARAA